MSMMGGQNSAMGGGGPAYEPMEPMGMDQGYSGGQPMMQSQYPAGPAMGTYNGGTGFMGDAMGTSAPMMTGAEPHAAGAAHEGHGHGSSIDKETGQAPRRCTDIQTCFCFLVYAVLAMTLLGVSTHVGNRGRLSHGTDYFGRVCGVDAGVENMPFLYWCRADPGSSSLVPTKLDLDHASCVPFCPTGNVSGVKIPCLRQVEKTEGSIPGGQFGNVETLVLKTQESLVMTTPYSTSPRGGRYCVPTDATNQYDVLNDNRALGVWGHNRILTVIGTLGHLYWLLALATFVSVIGGYMFIYSIRNCPLTIAYIFLIPITIFMLLFAVGFSLAIVPLIDNSTGFLDFYEEKNPFYNYWDIQKGSALSFLTGIFCWIVTAVLAGLIFNFNPVGLNDLMNAAFETFKSVPSLYYVPLFEAIAKFVVFFLGLQGFGTLAATGWIEKNRIHVNGAKFAGLSREFVPATQDYRFWLMAVVWCFLFFWMMEMCTAVGQFVTSYSVFKYYGVPKEKGKKGPAPAGTVSMGLRYAIIYHPGSILRGALLIPTWRPWKIMYWITAELAGEGQTPTTALGKALDFITSMTCGCFGLKNCCGMKDVSKQMVQRNDAANKDAFNDVVIRANDFDKAVGKAHDFLEHSHKIVQYLYRDLSQQTINMIGVGSISSTTAVIVFLIVSNASIYCNPISPLFVADPFLVTILAWILSAYIAFGFMTLWDHTADSLLYCYVWSRKWDRKSVEKFVPETLRYIVGFDDQENDRYPYYGKAKNNMYLRFWLPMVGVDPKAKAAPKPAPSTGPQGSPGLFPTRVDSGPQGSYMSGFGTGFGAWGRQEQAVSGQYIPEQSPLLP